MKIGFITLGCPKNRLDTEVMLHELMVAGYEITPEETEADIVVINTCAFIESAKKEAIETVLDVAWLKEHNGLQGIILCGCLVERYRDEIFEQLPEVDAIVGIGSIHDIVDAVRSVEKKNSQDLCSDACNKGCEGCSSEKYSSIKKNDEVVLGGDRIITTPEYFSYLKIAEGCSNFCTYCAIPLIRGRFRSRPMDDIVAEAKTLEKLGVKELNIVAQDTTRYGEDIYGKMSLVPLLRRLTEETNIPWIRLLYCYPDRITDELIEEIKTNDRILKYIDLPLQHISDDVLSRMKRRGDSTLIRKVISKLRDQIPDIVIRTTFIVGFPGETEEDFDTLCEFVKEVKFERLGVFTYSREEDTASYDMDGQIEEQLKQDRHDILMREQLDVVESYNLSMIGRSISVLCEGYDPLGEVYYGRSCMDAPDIDGKIYFKSDNFVENGRFVDVKIVDVIDYDLLGEL